jgi:hypothetical protein
MSNSQKERVADYKREVAVKNRSVTAPTLPAPAAKPEILTSTYGRHAPDAAKFAIGARVGDAKFAHQGTPRSPQVEEAIRARRDAVPGVATYANRNK